jgi:Family of unknown function (DUF6073)
MVLTYDQDTLVLSPKTASPPEATNLVPSAKTLSELRLLAMPEGGIDRLSFIVWDTIEVLGIGEDTVELKGYYNIERANPTASDWASASVDIRMLEMSVTGFSQKFGPIHASVNHDIGKLSQGQVQAGTVYPGIADAPKLCEMNGYMKFELSEVPITVFNKEPIILQHRITHIPPIGQGGGTLGRVAINLYPVNDPDGQPVAILRQVKTHIGSWL